MATGYVLYNKHAGDKRNEEDVRMLEVVIDEPLKFIDITNVKNYRVFLGGLETDDFIILAGGDGTLNHFANKTDGINYHNEVLYYPNGTGNDFARELGHQKECNPFPIMEYLKDLPCVIVNGKSSASLTVSVTALTIIAAKWEMS